MDRIYRQLLLNILVLKATIKQVLKKDIVRDIIAVTSGSP